MDINYSEIKEYVCDSNKLSEGKEVNVYYFGDKVVKIFHNDRKTIIKRISDEGLIRLRELPLQCFNKPIDIIYEDGRIAGYTEKYLKEKDISFDKINFDLIKQDLSVLSDNGFCIEDLFYNYIFTEEGLMFNDMTCYSYLKTDVPFLKQQNLKKNIMIMNNFLIGLLEFEAFRKGSSNEYTKMYLANEYRINNCGDSFYGDIIKENDRFK